MASSTDTLQAPVPRRTGARIWNRTLSVLMAVFLVNVALMIATVAINSFAKVWRGTWLPDGYTAQWYAAAWKEFTSDVSSMISNPAGGTTDFEVMASDFRADFLRMDYVHVSGSGTVTVFFSGHGA